MGNGSWLAYLPEEEAEEALEWELEAGEPEPAVVQAMDWKDWEAVPETQGAGPAELAVQGEVVEDGGRRTPFP